MGKCLILRDKNGFRIFRYLRDHFRFFSSTCNNIFRKRKRSLGLSNYSHFRFFSLLTVFFENEIDRQNFLTKLVSKLVWSFTDRSFRLPILVGIYRN